MEHVIQEVFCPVHGKRLVCMSCQMSRAGSIGGRSRSAAKVTASRESIKNTATHKAKEKYDKAAKRRKVKFEA